MSKLQEIKQLLCEEGYTCVLTNRREIFTSAERGVKPLLGLIEAGHDLRGAVAADKVVGRAAALLYAYAGAESVWAGVLSEGALEVFNRFSIAVEYGQLVPKIVNRRGDGVCPMEQLTAQISDPKEALAAIKEKLQQMTA